MSESVKFLSAVHSSILCLPDTENNLRVKHYFQMEFWNPKSEFQKKESWHKQSNIHTSIRLG